MSKQSAADIFHINDFRPYVRTWVRARGRGEFRRIAAALGVHTTLVSQIFNGRKCLTEEQAAKLCFHMGLNSLETDYFLKLVQIERAGAENLKTIYKRHLELLRKQASEIRSHVPESKEMSEQDRAIFYSSWQYTLIRLLTGLEQFQTAEKIASHLNLSLSRVQEILSFLTSRGLCTLKNGRFIRTEQNTHVEARSALSVRHHQNWRVKSLELQERMNPRDLAFTAPISLSKKDFDKIRGVLLQAISEVSKVVKDSPSEQAAYLAIDWIGI